MRTVERGDVLQRLIDVGVSEYVLAPLAGMWVFAALSPDGCVFAQTGAHYLSVTVDADALNAEAVFYASVFSALMFGVDCERKTSVLDSGSGWVRYASKPTIEETARCTLVTALPDGTFLVEFSW